uniref:Transposase n=1 Tax=Ascaris lumbricoides TaxID=6252 RepID=A0A0M3HS79_ASCLU
MEEAVWFFRFKNLVHVRCLHDGIKRLRQVDPRNPWIILDEGERILRRLNAMDEVTNHPIIELMIKEKLSRWIFLAVYEKKSEDPSWIVDKLRECVNKLQLEKKQQCVWPVT